MTNKAKIAVTTIGIVGSVASIIALFGNPFDREEGAGDSSVNIGLLGNIINNSTTIVSPDDDPDSRQHKLEFAFEGKKSGQRRNDNKYAIRFHWAPPGRFTMGSPDTEKKDEFVDYGEEQRDVTIDYGFWMAATEVTQGQWREVTSESFLDRVTRIAEEKESDYYSTLKVGSEYPMLLVSYDEVVRFCRQLTRIEIDDGNLSKEFEYRLPTSVEWEYCCRAGTQTAFGSGDKLSPLFANYNGQYAAIDGLEREEGAICEVGLFRANRWGFHDMHGNVWEYCSDIISGGRDAIIRGGSHISYGRECRCAKWSQSPISWQRDVVGFRLVLARTGEVNNEG